MIRGGLGGGSRTPVRRAGWAILAAQALLAGTLLVLAGTPSAAAASSPGPYSHPRWQVSTQHPRLLVHSGTGIGQGPTVEELQQRRLSGDRPRWAELKANREGWEGLLTPALRALLLGDLGRRTDVVARLQNRKQVKFRSSGRQSGGHMAIAFDWLHPTLTDDERRAIAQNIARAADGALLFLRAGEPDITHNFTYMALFTLLTAGLALADDPEQADNARRYLHESQVWLEGDGGIYETCQALDGGWPEGTQYGYRENTRLLLLMMHALRTATDHDPFERVRLEYGDFLRSVARSYMALTRPDMTLERLGDVNRNTPLLRDQHRFVIEALAAGLRHDGGDAEVPGMLQHFSDLVHEAYGDRDTHGNFQWGMMLFAHPQAPRAIMAYENQPRLQVFGRGTLDLVVLREGWDENGTFLSFVAGNHFVDHQHFDKGSFTLYHRGALLVDSGAYDGMYSGHHCNYAVRTLAHNAPLIFDDERPRPAKYKADGGQRVLRGLQHHGNWKDYQEHAAREHLDAADLRVASHGAAVRLPLENREDTAPSQADWRRFAVVQAELAGAYGGAVQHARRTLAWAPAARIILVHDDVDLSRALPMTFLLHTQQAPIPAGSGSMEAGIHRLGAVPWWSIARTGNLKLPTRTVTYDGRLFVRTLMQQPHVGRLVGGKGYQWIAHGENHSPGSAGNAPRESGRWRIEVQSAATRRHTMTHVLQLAAEGQYDMASGRLFEAGPWSVAHVISAPELVLAVAPPGGAAELTYDVDTTLPSLHLQIGWPAHTTLHIQGPGFTQTLRTDAEGVLSFEDPIVGAHRLYVFLP